MIKKILLILATILLIFVAILLVYWFFFKKASPLVNPQPTTSQESHFTLDISPAPSGQFNILLLGQGDPSHEGSSLTDSMMVLHLDTNRKTTSLIFIPRDLWVGYNHFAKTPDVSPDGEGKARFQASPQNVGKAVESLSEKTPSFQDGEAYKINEANSKDGLKLAEDAVSFVTGLPIQNAILIDFNGFAQAIDSLGEIEVTVTKSFDDYYFPIRGKELEICDKSPEEVAQLSATLSGFELEKQFPCRYEHLHFDAGKTHMDGATALKFARSRHSAQAGSDFDRGQRQQAILIGIKDKLLSLDALKNVDKLFNQMIKLVKTDLDLEGAKAIAALIIDPQEYEITQIIPSEENVLVASKGPGGQFILLPKAGENNWDSFRDFIRLFKNTTDF